MYTENFNEENEYDYSDDQNENIKTTNSGSNLKLIIIIVLAIILIGLIILVISGGKSGSKKSNKYVLNIHPDEIIVPFGKSQNISYEVRNNNELISDAVVRFTIDDETIATIDNTNITGVNYGKTSIIATYVDSDNNTVREIKEVTVADGTPNTPVTNVIFPDGDLKLPFNGTYDLLVTVEPTNGYVESKRFTSSNSSVVLVDNAGKVTAVSEGEAIIAINVNGTFKKDLKVYVSKDTEIPELVVGPTNITINKTIGSIEVGSSSNLTYTVTPSNVKTNVKWSSSDPSVLTIDNSGIITGIKEGTATVTVTADNNVSGNMKIEVVSGNVPVTDIILSLNSFNLVVGQMQTVTPVVVPSNATDKMITYTSDNTVVAALLPSDDTSSVTINALSAGAANITITCGSVTKTVSVIVTGNTTPSDSSGGSSGGGGGGCGSNRNLTCAAGTYAYCGKCKDCPAGSYCVDNNKYSCPAGKGSSSKASSCTTCTGNTYSKNGICTACPSGQTANEYHTACYTKSCATNQWKSGDTCIACPAGYYCNGTSKISCADDYYSTGSATSCKKCPTGQVSNSLHTSCYTPSSTPSNKCATGKYWNGSTCVTCPKGSYCVNSVKHNCPSGYTTNMQGAGSSTACIKL